MWVKKPVIDVPPERQARKMRRPSLRILLSALALIGLLVWQATIEESRLFALAADTGRIAWSGALDSELPSRGVPVVGGGRVVIGSAERERMRGRDERWALTAFDAATGRRLWGFEPAEGQFGDLHALDTVLVAPVVGEDRV